MSREYTNFILDCEKLLSMLLVIGSVIFQNTVVSKAERGTKKWQKKQTTTANKKTPHTSISCLPTPWKDINFIQFSFKIWKKKKKEKQNF